jgi:hypothetical protein
MSIHSEKKFYFFLRKRQDFFKIFLFFSKKGGKIKKTLEIFTFLRYNRKAMVRRLGCMLKNYTKLQLNVL